MSAVGGSAGHYISDGAIMQWLAQQQDRIYGQLEQAMDLSEQRADFVDSLNEIKAGLRRANESHDFSQVDADLQTFMKTYASNPDFADTCSGLADLSSRIHGDYQNAKDYAETRARYEKDLAAYTAAQSHSSRGGRFQDAGQKVATLLVPREPPQPITSYSKEDIDGWINLIDGKMDVSGKNDQLTMIHIQELKATLDQGAQLGSTFISSGDKTKSSIINNIA